MGRAQTHNQHSMVSDWPQADPKTWNIAQKLIDHQDLYPIYPDRPLPQFPKSNKIPMMTAWSQHRFILFFAILPLLIHQAIISLTGWHMNKTVTVFFYGIAYNLISTHEVRVLRRLVYKHGVLDGAVPRDGIPNTGAWKIVGQLEKAAVVRSVMVVLMSYRPEKSPFAALHDSSTWLPFILKLSLYGVILDFFFYSYHRACHEIPALWKYHRTYHLVKHPTAVLSAFADDEQEIVEIFVIPFMTYMTLKSIGLSLGHYEWWICLEYVTWSEIWGHCGLRVHGIVPSPISTILCLLNMEFALEDHDLHHRRGWKKSYNYGKQTRVWDRLFGTCTDRVEAKMDNIDYENRVAMPLFSRS